MQCRAPEQDYHRWRGETCGQPLGKEKGQVIYSQHTTKVKNGPRKYRGVPSSGLERRSNILQSEWFPEIQRIGRLFHLVDRHLPLVSRCLVVGGLQF